jgi:Amt family ammonium transporter
MLVPILNTDASFEFQFIGTVSIFTFVFGASYIIWYTFKKTIGVRVSMEEEIGGSDMWETGSKAYPEFMKGSDE